MDQANKQRIESYYAAANADDRDAMVAVYAEDGIQEWPQSSEVTRGRERIREVTVKTPRIPTCLVHRVVGAGDLWIAEWTADYGDGVPWRNATVWEFRDGQVIRKTDYFGGPVEAPAWRNGLTDIRPRPKPGA